MPVYHSGQIIKEARIRKHLTRERLLYESDLMDISLHRLEKGEQVPRPKTRDKLRSALLLPADGFLCTHLENQPMGAYVLRDKLIHMLYEGDIHESSIILTELESMEGFDQGLNRQFILSQKAALMNLMGHEPQDILSVIFAGLFITMDEFDENEIGNTALFLEESNLLHTLAHVRVRMGNTASAIYMLDAVWKDLSRAPSCDRENSMRLIHVLKSLAVYLLDFRDYVRAQAICDIGVALSAERVSGKLIPEFLYTKALALAKTGGDPRRHLQEAYFGQLLLRKTEQAQEIYTAAKNLGIHIETHGADKIPFPESPKKPYTWGDLSPYGTIGEMISTARKQSGINLNGLSKGICNTTTLFRIEKGKLEGNYRLIEPLMQRLGRDINMYCNFFLHRGEYEEIQMRDEMISLLTSQQFTKAADLLSKLESRPTFTKGVNLQFVLATKAMIYASNGGASHPRYREMILAAIAITQPDFNEFELETFFLTYNESMLINMLAGYYSSSGSLERAAKIFEGLIQNISEKRLDETEKAKEYAMFCYNYSTCLGKLGRHEEALQTIEDGEGFECSHNHFLMLPGLAFNKAYNLIMLGESSAAEPYVALAYYGFSIFKDNNENANNMLSMISCFARVNMGITIE